MLRAWPPRTWLRARRAGFGRPTGGACLAAPAPSFVRRSLRCPGRRRLGLGRPLRAWIGPAAKRLGAVREQEGCGAPRQGERAHAGGEDLRLRRSPTGPLHARCASRTGGRPLRERLSRGGPVTRHGPGVFRLRDQRRLPADGALALVVLPAARPARAAVAFRRRVDRHDARRAREDHRDERRGEPRDDRDVHPKEHSRECRDGGFRPSTTCPVPVGHLER